MLCRLLFLPRYLGLKSHALLALVFQGCKYVLLWIGYLRLFCLGCRLLLTCGKNALPAIIKNRLLALHFLKLAA